MKLIIRYGAGINTVTVDGVRFDRNELDRRDDKKLCRMIRDAFRIEQRQTA